MIIDKANKGFQTRSDIQNENWTNDDVFIVDDSSELALKVTQYYPYYDFILDVDGNLIDITPTKRPTERPPEPTVEEQLKELKNQLMTADERYKALNKTTVLIGEIKVAKLAQLEELCEKSIVDGFNHTINDISYRFSCSINAQANFQGTDTLFKDGFITECEWTVTNNTTGAIERVMLDQTTFNQIKLQVFTHINSNISKLRNTLQLQVESALTNDEIDLIVW